MYAPRDRTYISRMEHDKKSPTLDTLFRICDALGIQRLHADCSSRTDQDPRQTLSGVS